MLERTAVRRSFRKIERDSASLLVLRDSSSFRSSYTDTLSKLSIVFAFDAQILASRIYHRAFQSNLTFALKAWRKRRDGMILSDESGSNELVHLWNVPTLPPSICWWSGPSEDKFPWVKGNSKWDQDRRKILLLGEWYSVILTINKRY